MPVASSGIDTHMVYSRPVKAGDVLTATAVEISRSSKLSHYRVDVVRGDGKLVAGLTGTAFISGQSVYRTGFLDTFKEFPPRHEPAGFSIDQIVEKLNDFLVAD